MRPVPVAQRRVRLAAAVLPFVVLATLLLWFAPAGSAQDRRGGEVRMIWAGDVDSIDPAVAYGAWSLMVHTATQRPLLSFRPESSARAVPDLAAAPPEIAPDGLSVTVRIKQGIRFSPPVNRAVTSRDVKYAIERGFFSSVNTPYAPLYFADIVGARPGVAPGTEIPGIETPDDQTIVFRLARPRAGTLVAAMVMVMTAPVPPEYARPLDNRRTSAYGRRHVATGPYMIRNDAAGSLTGYRPNRRIQLVRNPSWAPETDFRPAHLDAIDIRIGREDTAAATREILRGRRLLSGDFAPPLSELRRELRRYDTQFAFPDAGAILHVTMNTRLAPFDDVNVRRAVVAGFDRARALRLAGGRRAGTLATHYIPPGTTGFAEAGGRSGPGLDFYARPSGSLRLAARYLRRAGYEAGRYTGRREIQMVGASDTAGRLVSRYAADQFRRLGFRVRLRLLRPDRAYEACSESTRRVHVCPIGGWQRDFPDAQSVIDPLFGGENITRTGNNNWSQLDVPEINAAIETAKGLTDPTARARAWGDIDRRITALAPSVAVMWPRAALARSADVAGVVASFGYWDLTFTALR
jgi:peptide/nickel transport system substrate-binding protein